MIAALESRGFRNLADARVKLDSEVVVIHGPNGAGKTNLLEAVYFGLTGRSFRPGSDRDLIGFDQPSARVELELAGGSVVLAALDRSGARRHRLQGRSLSTGDPERPLVSVFHPDRLQLVKGPPAHRRAHLDRLVAAVWPARSELRARYGRTLAQRNALASRVRAELADHSSLASWDERLAAEAEPLMAARSEALEALRGPFAAMAVSLGLEQATIGYRPRAAGGAAEIAGELAERRAAELGRAYLSYGPQLDEVELRIDQRSLRRFGSQGQQRAALLALLFAERSVLVEAGRPGPLMLLDDVMSELDPERRELLVATLRGVGQALLTATEPEHVPAAAGARRVAVRAGRAAALAECSDAARPRGDGGEEPTVSAGSEAA
jgi:DNA replication and repair protein RecF